MTCQTSLWLLLVAVHFIVAFMGLHALKHCQFTSCCQLYYTAHTKRDPDIDRLIAVDACYRSTPARSTATFTANCSLLTDMRANLFCDSVCFQCTIMAAKWRNVAAETVNALMQWTLQLLIRCESIGVPPTFGKIFFGQLLRRIRAFSGKTNVKFGHLVNFSYIFFGKKFRAPPPKVDWAPTLISMAYTCSHIFSRQRDLSQCVMFLKRKAQFGSDGWLSDTLAQASKDSE